MEKRCGRLRLAPNYMKSTEIFVTDGLVWGRDLKGHDPKTGKVVRTLAQEMNGPMSHDRCYRNRITHRYYLNSATRWHRFPEAGWNRGDVPIPGRVPPAVWRSCRPMA